MYPDQKLKCEFRLTSFKKQNKQLWRSIFPSTIDARWNDLRCYEVLEITRIESKRTEKFDFNKKNSLTN